MFEEKVNLVMLLALTSCGVAVFSALVVYLSAYKLKDILRHQDTWYVQDGRRGVSPFGASFAALFWMASYASGAALLLTVLPLAAALYGLPDLDKMQGVSVVVVLLATVAGVRDAVAKWREMHWISSDTIVPLAQHMDTKIDLAEARRSVEPTGAQ